MNTLGKRLNAPTSPYIFGAFRVLFALVALYSALRFWLNGWIERLYLEPKLHFTFYGFSWVRLPDNPTMVYVLYASMIVCILGLLLGFAARLFALGYFLLFTYFELIDVSYYLNHYYFISLLALLMVFLPSHAALSINKKSPHPVAYYYIAALRLLIGAVYFYAGIAKLTPDWLAGQPLESWFNAFQYLPLIGETIGSPWFAVSAAWAALIFDTSLPFLLLFKKTRTFAYLAALVFHGLTALMFPIGVFPLVMSVCALVFFPTSLWEKRLRQLSIIQSKKVFNPASTNRVHNLNWTKWAIAILLLWHLVFPWRYLLYPGNVLWHEQGFRFSWRVMLMEKNGLTELEVHLTNGQVFEINNQEYLTPIQEKMMSTQPDLIVQFGKIIEKEFLDKGYSDFKILAKTFISLNGRQTFRMIQNNVDLRTVSDGFVNKTWLNPAPR